MADTEAYSCKPAQILNASTALDLTMLHAIEPYTCYKLASQLNVF